MSNRIDWNWVQLVGSALENNKSSKTQAQAKPLKLISKFQRNRCDSNNSEQQGKTEDFMFSQQQRSKNKIKRKQSDFLPISCGIISGLGSKNFWILFGISPVLYFRNCAGEIVFFVPAVPDRSKGRGGACAPRRFSPANRSLLLNYYFLLLSLSLVIFAIFQTRVLYGELQRTYLNFFFAVFGMVFSIVKQLFKISAFASFYWISFLHLS